MSTITSDGNPDRGPSQGREPCACSTLRDLARHATVIYDSILEPAGLKHTQYAVLVRLDRLVQCSLVELSNVCGLDVTSLSRGLRPLIDAGLIACGRGKDGRTKRYELTARGKQVLVRAFPLWEKAQSRMHDIITPEHVRILSSLAGPLRSIVAQALE